FIGLDDVDDLSFPAHGVEDPQLPAVPADHPGVARLAASPGVEDGAVQDDDPVADLEDVALGPVQIAVAAGEFFDLHGSLLLGKFGAGSRHDKARVDILAARRAPLGAFS